VAKLNTTLNDAGAEDFLDRIGNATRGDMRLRDAHMAFVPA
jgi:hypothetical protein